MKSKVQEIRELTYRLLRSLENSDRDTCACFGVTPLQGLALLSVAKKQPLGIRQLAQEMQLSVSTMSRVVDKLVMAELICRKEDKNDRRAVLCTLTESGKDTSAQLEGCYNDFFNQLVAGIPEKDLSGFLVGLRVMVKQIQSYAAGCGCKGRQD